MKTETLKHADFGDIRIIEIGSQYYFVARDVAKALGYKSVQKAIEKLEDDEKLYSRNGSIKESICTRNGSIGKGRPIVLTNESGLYHLIFQSRKPKATEFRRWVTSEVLPSIRKTGTYQTEKRVISNDTLNKTKPTTRPIATCSMSIMASLMSDVAMLDEKSVRIAMAGKLKKFVQSVAITEVPV